LDDIIATPWVCRLSRNVMPALPRQSHDVRLVKFNKVALYHFLERGS